MAHLIKAIMVFSVAASCFAKGEGLPVGRGLPTSSEPRLPYLAGAAAGRPPRVGFARESMVVRHLG